MGRNIIGVLLLVLSLGFYSLFFLPKVHEVRDISIQKAAAADVKSAKEQRLQALKQLSGTFASQQEKISKYVSTLPQEPEVPEVLVSLEAMVRDANLNLQSLVPQVNKTDRDVAVTVVGSGDLSGLERLFAAIAQNDRPISLKSVTINKVEDENSLAFTLILRVPFIPLQDDGAKGE